MSTEELPVVVDCQGESLIGIVHRPTRPATRGVLSIVAGGPQYRGGCCRQLVYMARELADAGIPVMRFDYRGMGDSSGPFKGFQHVEEDVRAALEVFQKTVPTMNEVVLWGGCDAASASLIHGHQFPIVTGMILGNPYAHSEETRAAVERHYYLARLRDKAFWKKLLTLRFNPVPAARAMLKAFAKRRGAAGAPAPGNSVNIPFTARMLDGLNRFQGRILLQMSGQSLTSQEFDELAKTSPAWKKALSAARIERVDLPNADQAFSTIEARESMVTEAKRWLLAWR